VTGTPNRARRRSWPKRRAWLDRIAADNRLTSGAKSWLLLLARRSDDQGKPVWGNQRRMADQIGRCDRSVRRYRAEAEQLGYVDCYRSKPVRDRQTGRWGRCKSNAYYLRLPARLTASEPAPRRRERAPACVVPRGHPSRVHRADSDARSSPFGGATTAPTPPVNSESEATTHPQPVIPPPDPAKIGPEEAHDRFERLRRALHPQQNRPGQ